MAYIYTVASAQSAHTAFDAKNTVDVYGFYPHRPNGSSALATASIYDIEGNEIAFINIPLDNSPYTIVYPEPVTTRGLVINTGQALRLNILLKESFSYS